MIKPILCPLIWYTTFPTTLEEDTILKDQPDILKELAKVYLETVTQNFNHLLIEFTGQRVYLILSDKRKLSDSDTRLQRMVINPILFIAKPVSFKTKFIFIVVTQPY